MEIPATVTSKGQITIPAEVRRALNLSADDRVVFRLDDDGVVLRPADKNGGEARAAELEKVPVFFDLAGSVPVPPDVDPADWLAQSHAAWDAAVRERE